MGLRWMYGIDSMVLNSWKSIRKRRWNVCVCFFYKGSLNCIPFWAMIHGRPLWGWWLCAYISIETADRIKNPSGMWSYAAEIFMRLFLYPWTRFSLDSVIRLIYCQRNVYESRKKIAMIFFSMHEMDTKICFVLNTFVFFFFKNTFHSLIF